MHREPVTSSNIESIGYDDATQTLEVRFHNGRTYRYSSVPPEEYQALVSAESVGRHFSQRIKGQYEGQRADEDSQA